MFIDWIKRTMNVIAGDIFTPKIATYGIYIYVAFITNGFILSGSNVGGKDIVIAKLRNDGKTMWIQQPSDLNTTGDETDIAITCDSDGELYGCYVTNGAISGTGNQNIQDNTDTNTQDLVVFRMNPSGSVVWKKQTAEFNTSGNEIKPDVLWYKNNLYVTYVTNSVVSESFTNTGDNNDIVLMLINKSGSILQINQDTLINTIGSDSFPKITGCGDYIYVVYASEYELSSIVIVKFNASDCQFIKRFDGSTYGINAIGSNTYPSITTDGVSNIYISYTTTGNFNGQLNSGNTDIVIINVDINDRIIWKIQSSRLNTSASENNSNILFNGNSLYIAYTTDGTTAGNTNTGLVDIVCAKINKNSTIEQVTQSALINSDRYDLNPILAGDDYGNIYMVYLNKYALDQYSKIYVKRLSPLKNLNKMKDSYFSHTNIQAKKNTHIDTTEFTSSFSYLPFIMPAVQIESDKMYDVSITESNLTEYNTNTNFVLDRDDISGMRIFFTIDLDYVFFDYSGYILVRSYNSIDQQWGNAEPINTAAKLCVADNNSPTILYMYDDSFYINATGQSLNVSLESLNVDYTNNCSIVSHDDLILASYYNPNSKKLKYLYYRTDHYNIETININGFGEQCIAKYDQTDNKFYIFGMKNGNVTAIKTGNIDTDILMWSEIPIIKLSGITHFDACVNDSNYYVCYSSASNTYVSFILKSGVNYIHTRKFIAREPSQQVMMNIIGDQLRIGRSTNSTLTYIAIDIPTKSIIANKIISEELMDSYFNMNTESVYTSTGFVYKVGILCKRTRVYSNAIIQTDTVGKYSYVTYSTETITYS